MWRSNQPSKISIFLICWRVPLPIQQQKFPAWLHWLGWLGAEGALHRIASRGYLPPASAAYRLSSPLSASAPGPVQPWSATRLLLTQSSDKGRGHEVQKWNIVVCSLACWDCFVFGCFVLGWLVLGGFVFGWLVLASQHLNLLSASGPHTVSFTATIRWFSFEITSIRNTSYSVCFCTWLVTSTMLDNFQLWSDISWVLDILVCITAFAVVARQWQQTTFINSYFVVQCDNLDKALLGAPLFSFESFCAYLKRSLLANHPLITILWQ